MVAKMIRVGALIVVMLLGATWLSGNTIGELISDLIAVWGPLILGALLLSWWEKSAEWERKYNELREEMSQIMREYDEKVQTKVNVYADETRQDIIARVQYNAVLDSWHRELGGWSWCSGERGHHLGITKLRNGRYALIYGSGWGVVVSAEEALQAILKSGNLYLLYNKRFKDLKAMADEQEGEN
jgi:hypothetical protein